MVLGHNDVGEMNQAMLEELMRRQGTQHPQSLVEADEEDVDDFDPQALLTQPFLLDGSNHSLNLAKHEFNMSDDEDDNSDINDVLAGPVLPDPSSVNNDDDDNDNSMSVSVNATGSGDVTTGMVGNSNYNSGNDSESHSASMATSSVAQGNKNTHQQHQHQHQRQQPEPENAEFGMTLEQYQLYQQEQLQAQQQQEALQMRQRQLQQQHHNLQNAARNHINTMSSGNNVMNHDSAPSMPRRFHDHQQQQIPSDMHEVQRQLDAVQQQIQAVQQQSSQLENQLQAGRAQMLSNKSQFNGMTMAGQNGIQPMHHQQQQQQQRQKGQFNQASLQQQQQPNTQSQARSPINMAGMSMGRAPPGRSISMPVSLGTRGNHDSSMSVLAAMQREAMQASNLVQQSQSQQQQQQHLFNGAANGSIGGPIGMQVDMGQSVQQPQQQQHHAMMQQLLFHQRQQQNQQQHTGMEGVSSLGMNTSMPNIHSMQMSLSQNGGPGLNQSNFDPAQFMNSMQQQIQQQANSQQNPANGSDGRAKTVSEAMEKLCESMKRSAMSRSLVKQFSNRSLSQQNPARNLMNQNSSRSLSRQGSSRSLQKQGSSRTLGRQISGRNLVRANSGRSLMMGNEDGNFPVRRPGSDTKHRLHHQRDPLARMSKTPSRGVLRHKSQPAVLNSVAAAAAASRGITQIDEKSVGMF